MIFEKAKIWIIASRPHTLSAAVVPILVGTALAFQAGRFDWLLFLLTLMGALLVQVGTNLTDEFADHGTPASGEKFPAPHKVIARGLLSQRAVMGGAAVVFGLATLIGGWLVWVTGWPLLVVCLISLSAAYGYSAGPWPLGDFALGELTVFLLMGPVMVGATYFVQARQLTGEVLAYSLPVAALVSAILIVNNLRDREEDSKGGRWTLTTLFGETAVRLLYSGLLVLAFAIPLREALLRETGLLLLPWLTLPLALMILIRIWRHGEKAQLHRVLKATSALHLLFGLLLALGVVLGG